MARGGGRHYDGDEPDGGLAPPRCCFCQLMGLLFLTYRLQSVAGMARNQMATA